jgi:hypothetical protein
MIYYVDIDETICYYNKEKCCEKTGARDYKKAIPIKTNIEKINKLYEEGNTVIYWTARGTVTGIDWYDLTGQQLDQWGAKYHEYKVGKPAYDVFICDKAINSQNFFK